MNEHNPIPKILHYVWVGNKPQSKLIQKCIQSWKKYAPEYEVRFWNEENSPMNHPYVKEMYAQKKWAFVSDYIRFWALEKEGGVYLDTDMELLQSLDQFLSDEVFIGRSNSGNVESSIIGARAHHPFIQEALRFYDEDTEFSIENTSPIVLEKTLQKGTFPTVHIYNAEYFHPCDEGKRCDPRMLSHAYARHHWAESWVPFKTLRKILRRLGIFAVLKKILRKQP